MAERRGAAEPVHALGPIGRERQTAIEEAGEHRPGGRGMLLEEATPVLHPATEILLKTRAIRMSAVSQGIGAVGTSVPVQVMFYLVVAFVAARIAPDKGFEVAATVLAAFALTGPSRVVLGTRGTIDAVSCFIGAALLYVAITFIVTSAGASLGEESLALAIFVPVFAGTFTVAMLVRALLAWRRRAIVRANRA